MKHPNLFEVPKDSPSRRDKIKAFKEKHGIHTYKSPGVQDEPWNCLKNPGVIGGTDVSAMDPWGLVAKYGILLEEAGFYVTGKTEVEAIREVCAKTGIKCDL